MGQSGSRVTGEGRPRRRLACLALQLAHAAVRLQRQHLLLACAAVPAWEGGESRAGELGLLARPPRAPTRVLLGQLCGDGLGLHPALQAGLPLLCTWEGERGAVAATRVFGIAGSKPRVAPLPPPAPRPPPPPPRDEQAGRAARAPAPGCGRGCLGPWASPRWPCPWARCHPWFVVQEQEQQQQQRCASAGRHWGAAWRQGARDGGGRMGAWAGLVLAFMGRQLPRSMHARPRCPPPQHSPTPPPTRPGRPGHEGLRAPPPAHGRRAGAALLGRPPGRPARCK